MINRVLIRIKVVQMLYSYLLTKNDFTLPAPPGDGLKDKTFAYNLYLNLLRLLLDMGGFSNANGRISKAMAGNIVIKALSEDLEVRNLIQEAPEGYNVLLPLIANFEDSIANTHAYRSYVRLKSKDVATDTTFLTTSLDDTLRNDQLFFDSCRKIAGFTIAGYAEGFAMLTNTIKSFCDNRQSSQSARNALKASLDKGYELYHSLLLMVNELTDMQAAHLDNQKHKHLPTVDDLNPNTKFIDNRLAKLLADSPEMADYFESNPFSWNQSNPGLLRRLLKRIVESDIYTKYMASAENSLEEDCELWRNLFKKIIFPSDDLAEALENLSVYWNDDINIMDSFVLKTIKRVEADGKLNLLPKYKDEEDARFGAELFQYSIENFDYYRSLIDRFIDPKQWDSDRLAFMDIVIMTAAIAEMLNYPAIPIAVTMNEFIEIANCYSTPKSGQFVNGILYSVINYLKSNGKLSKS